MSTLWWSLTRPALLKIDPEFAHGLSIRALASGLLRTVPANRDRRLEVTVAGLTFPNPLGMAAGYDKNARVPDALLRLGFGHVEIGSVTPRPQAGNSRPRIFRLPADAAVINRLSFNNDGHEAVLSRLAAREGGAGIVGVNLGANKDSTDFIADYETGIETFWPVASYFTVNISSPNTPGLRGLQKDTKLRELLDRIVGQRDRLAAIREERRPVFLKFAPDLTEPELDGIAKAVSASGVDGMVISNTTLARDGLTDPRSRESGGLSGKPLYVRSTVVLARMRLRLGSDFPLIGVGGVGDPASAIGKIEAGADLVQLYTGMIYGGPAIAAELLKAIGNHLDAVGVGSVEALSGRKTKQWANHRLAGESKR